MSALFLLAALASAQEPVDYDAPQRPARWHNYVVPHLESAAMNLALHGTTRYLLDLDWARISAETVRDNRGAWTLDQNEFTVNQVGHPYQGAFYYNAARLNQLTYIEALPVVLFASWQWERYLENESPSNNDLVTTSWGGPIMGEVLFRLSSQILDDTSRGRARVGREIAAGLLNPTRGLERVVTGSAWRTGAPRLAVPMRHELFLGYDRVQPGEGDELQYYRLHYEVAYGDAFARKSLGRPFDVFDLRLDVTLNRQRPVPGVLLLTTGALLGRRFSALGSPDNFLGLFQGYDYVETNVFNVGTTALGPGWWARFPMGSRVSLSLKWTWMLSLMGAIDSPFAEEVTEPTYILGPGSTSSFRLEARHDRAGSLFFETRRYLVISAGEPRGWEFLGLQRWGAVANIWRGYGLGVNVAWYDRSAGYEEFGDIRRQFVMLQAHVTSRW